MQSLFYDHVYENLYDSVVTRIGTILLGRCRKLSFSMKAIRSAPPPVRFGPNELLS